MLTDMRLLLTCSDEYRDISRFDVSCVPQQALMELFVSKLTRENPFLNSVGMVPDISEWEGVSLDDEENVTEISWQHFDVSPDCTLHLPYVPQTTRKLSITTTNLESTLDMCQLPQSLLLLDVSRNRLEGTVDLTRLPPRMAICILAGNYFEGALTTSKLPASLEVLNVAENYFHGELDLTCLPPRIRAMHMQWNTFSGNLSLQNVPASLELLSLHENEFQGALDLRLASVHLIVHYTSVGFDYVIHRALS